MMLTLKAIFPLLYVSGIATVLAAPTVNETESLNAREVARQTSPLWAVNFYRDHDCKDYLSSFISDDSGSPQSCTTKGLDIGDAYSVEWVPGFNSRLRASSNNHCSNGCCANTFGEEYEGCTGFTQNVNPPKSWEVYKV